MAFSLTKKYPLHARPLFIYKSDKLNYTNVRKRTNNTKIYVKTARLSYL